VSAKKHNRRNLFCFAPEGLWGGGDLTGGAQASSQSLERLRGAVRVVPCPLAPQSTPQPAQAPGKPQTAKPGRVRDECGVIGIRDTDSLPSRHCRSRPSSAACGARHPTARYACAVHGAAIGRTNELNRVEGKILECGARRGCQASVPPNAQGTRAPARLGGWGTMRQRTKATGHRLAPKAIFIAGPFIAQSIQRDDGDGGSG